MVVHIVLFKWKPDVSSETIGTVLEALNGLKKKIPVIRDFHAGLNFSDRSGGHTHMLYSTFASAEDLQTYQVHPDHQAVVTGLIRPNLESLVVGDVEFPG